MARGSLCFDTRTDSSAACVCGFVGAIGNLAAACALGPSQLQHEAEFAIRAAATSSARIN